MTRDWLVSTWIAVLVSASSLAQTTTRVSVSSSNEQGNDNSEYTGRCSISADGRHVAFSSNASNLVPGDTNGKTDAFVHDRRTGQTTRVSVDSSGTEGNSYSSAAGPSISADGRYVAFDSIASNLVLGDTNGSWDIFIHDLQTGITTRVSVDSTGNQANAFSTEPVISGDGRHVAFVSAATNLVPGGTNGHSQVFVHDMQTGATTLVSVSSSGAQSDHDAGTEYELSISFDGRYVAFASAATNLVSGDTNGYVDVFVRDLQANITTRVSTATNGGQGESGSYEPAISADGRWVAFASDATNLVPGGFSSVPNVFLHDQQTGETTLVSSDSAGHPVGQSVYPSVSSDGRFVSFSSLARNLVSSDSNGTEDIFQYDRLTRQVTLNSIGPSAVHSNGPSLYSSLSADARYVAFVSVATNLVDGDTNGYVDVFVHDSGAASAFVSLCLGDGSSIACPCANNGVLNHGCDNSAMTGGARLSVSGEASQADDTVQLSSNGELPDALSVVLQGNSIHPPVAFGSGLLCTGGVLERIYTKPASGGVMIAPRAGDQSILARSAALGDPISLGATRIYQVYYRDANPAFCVGGFNVSNAIAIAWGS